MSQPLGISFSPTYENAQQSRGMPGATPQGSIKTLNFRLPRVTGAASANAISPLVGQDRRGSSFGGAVLQSVFRTVLGADAASTLFSGSPAASAVGQPGRDSGSAVLRALSGGGSESGRGDDYGGSHTADGYDAWLRRERELNRGSEPIREPGGIAGPDFGASPAPDRGITVHPGSTAPGGQGANEPFSEVTPFFDGGGPASPWEQEHGGYYVGSTDPRIDRDGNYH